MTEEEAKTKWCPQAAIEKSLRLHAQTVLAAHNPSNEQIANNITLLVDNNDQKCIASDCMMWVHRQTLENGKHGHCGLTSRG